jgi:hypothetical protein
MTQICPTCEHVINNAGTGCTCVGCYCRDCNDTKIPETPLDRLKERAKNAKIDYSDAGIPHLIEEGETPSALSAREWLCGGGGGFEDGEDGIRACTMSAEHAIELMDEFAADLREKLSTAQRELQEARDELNGRKLYQAWKAAEAELARVRAEAESDAMDRLEPMIAKRAQRLMMEHYDADLYKRALEDHMKVCNRPMVIEKGALQERERKGE